MVQDRSLHVIIVAGCCDASDRQHAYIHERTLQTLALGFERYRDARGEAPRLTVLRKGSLERMKDHARLGVAIEASVRNASADGLHHTLLLFYGTAGSSKVIEHKVQLARLLAARTHLLLVQYQTEPVVTAQA